MVGTGHCQFRLLPMLSTHLFIVVQATSEAKDVLFFINLGSGLRGIHHGYADARLGWGLEGPFMANILKMKGFGVFHIEHQGFMLKMQALPRSPPQRALQGIHHGYADTRLAWGLEGAFMVNMLKMQGFGRFPC